MDLSARLNKALPRARRVVMSARLDSRIDDAVYFVFVCGVCRFRLFVGTFL